MATSTVPKNIYRGPFGQRKIEMNGKIVGGQPAVEGEIPWQVSIQTTSSSQSCGGSIISPDWILTAAHCSDITPSNYQIRSGTLTFASGGAVHTISQIVVHEAYDGSTQENDIAVWQVDPPFEWDTQTGPCDLPVQDVPTPDGTLIRVSGWGTLRFGGGVSDDLMRVEIPIVDKSTCNEAYVEFGGIPPNQICAGIIGEGGVDSCQGDSGGPLYLGTEVRGIVSWGVGCAWPNYPGVYTEVSPYRDWINTNTGV